MARSKSREEIREPNIDGLDNERWLGWFLRNHTPLPLIEAGIWKKSSFIVADHGADMDGVAAMRTAYKLDGSDGAYAVLIALMIERIPAGTRLPEVPEHWNERVRYWAETLRDPERASTVGMYRRDWDKPVQVASFTLLPKKDP